MIPVYVDSTQRAVPAEGTGKPEQRRFVTAECARCGKCAEAIVSKDFADGTASARKKAARAEALSRLTSICAERLPWDVAPAHEEWYVPRGLSLFCEGKAGEMLPCLVDRGTAAGKVVVFVAKGKEVYPHIGVPLDVPVYVVPDDESAKLADAATEFARELVRRGYKHARVGTKQAA